MLKIYKSTSKGVRFMHTRETKKTVGGLLARIFLLVILDVVLVVSCSFMALFIGLDFDMVKIYESQYTALVIDWLWFDVLLTIGLFAIFRLYNSLWNFAGEDELTFEQTIRLTEAET
jgi:hypothetical protein